jgi:hypothetical protein
VTRDFDECHEPSIAYGCYGHPFLTVSLARQTKSGANKPYSRKSKSLGLLAVRFVDWCREIDDGTISLDAASKTLVVVRRRIYDVVNVLQSIGIVARQGKNTYTWHGAAGMRATLADIQAGLAAADDADDKGTKRGESLGALSRKFVQLFLESDGQTVLSLESAAAGMQKREGSSTPDRAQGAAKTKVRRLYDVANIFAALGIIVKKRVPGARKPGFVWNATSPLLAGTEEFFTFGTRGSYEDDEGEEEEEEGDEGECIGEDEDSNESRGHHRKRARATGAAVAAVATGPPPPPAMTRPQRINKRKLFDHDDETYPSPGSIMGLISSTFRQQQQQQQQSQAPLSQPQSLSQPLASLPAVPELEQADIALNAKPAQVAAPPTFAVAMREGRPLKFPSVLNKSGAFGSPPVSKQRDAAMSFASPETEKSVASLLLTFGGGSPLFPSSSTAM